MDEFQVEAPRIMVVGCGGAGSNTITTLTGMGIQGAATIAANTDAKHLKTTNAHQKILLGKNTTRGLGAGGYPEVGRQAAMESRNDLKRVLEKCDLAFVTAGMGGGTGTGAAPIVAQTAKENGAIVIGAVTLPMKIEGARIHKAEEGLQRLRNACDTVIVIENQRLLEVAGNRPLKEAFAFADNLIASMIKGITETISQPSLVNLDFADVRTIMSSGGVATIGVGESDSADRAFEAVSRALAHPLLDVEYAGAKGALIQIIGGEDMKLDEINTIGETVAQNMAPESVVMWGARINPEFGGKIQVITIITGVSSPYIIGPEKAHSQQNGKFDLEQITYDE
ncbi:MAG: cell division protein FtsZ [Candidatus Aenigmarchaeota archaeon]|nr:cell division protein FtsZ [Candidatus Aenigmarchaeota archaeon]